MIPAGKRESSSSGAQGEYMLKKPIYFFLRGVRLLGLGDFDCLDPSTKDTGIPLLLGGFVEMRIDFSLSAFAMINSVVLI